MADLPTIIRQIAYQEASKQVNSIMAYYMTSNASNQVGQNGIVLDMMGVNLTVLTSIGNVVNPVLVSDRYVSPGDTVFLGNDYIAF